MAMTDSTSDTFKEKLQKAREMAQAGRPAAAAYHYHGALSRLDFPRERYQDTYDADQLETLILAALVAKDQSR